MASFLASTVPTGYGGTGGSEIIPCISHMYISYQSPAPSLPGGRLGGPPEAAGVPLPFEEAGPLLWWGVDDFPLCRGLWSFCSGRRWTAVHPGSGWVPVCSHQGLVDSCPAASQRLPWMQSWFGPASVEVVYH